MLANYTRHEITKFERSSYNIYPVQLGIILHSSHGAYNTHVCIIADYMYDNITLKLQKKQAHTYEGRK